MNRVRGFQATASPLDLDAVLRRPGARLTVGRHGQLMVREPLRTRDTGKRLLGWVMPAAAKRGLVADQLGSRAMGQRSVLAFGGETGFRHMRVPGQVSISEADRLDNLKSNRPVAEAFLQSSRMAWTLGDRDRVATIRTRLVTLPPKEFASELASLSNEVRRERAAQFPGVLTALGTLLQREYPELAGRREHILGTALSGWLEAGGQVDISDGASSVPASGSGAALREHLDRAVARCRLTPGERHGRDARVKKYESDAARLGVNATVLDRIKNLKQAADTMTPDQFETAISHLEHALRAANRRHDYDLSSLSRVRNNFLQVWSQAKADPSQVEPRILECLRASSQWVGPNLRADRLVQALHILAHQPGAENDLRSFQNGFQTSKLMQKVSESLATLGASDAVGDAFYLNALVDTLLDAFPPGLVDEDRFNPAAAPCVLALDGKGGFSYRAPTRAERQDQQDERRGVVQSETVVRRRVAANKPVVEAFIARLSSLGSQISPAYRASFEKVRGWESLSSLSCASKLAAMSAALAIDMPMQAGAIDIARDALRTDVRVAKLLDELGVPAEGRELEIQIIIERWQQSEVGRPPASPARGVQPESGSDQAVLAYALQHYRTDVAPRPTAA